MNKQDIAWLNMYKFAKIYSEKNGNLDIPSTFVTDDGYTYNPNGKIKLGMWCTNQRMRCNPNSWRGQLLVNLGMHFKKRSLSWNEMYEFAKKYSEKHGNLKVPLWFKTDDGITHNSNGSVNLGTWIGTQKRKCDPFSERGQLLIEIGMKFERRTLKIRFSWKEMYQFAKKYFEKHGNLKVPLWFKTNDGYTYDPNGCINLGQWLDTQRQNCDPLSENGYLLDCIGMIWSIRKNRFNIIRVCYESNIDFEINMSVLECISFKTFEIKLAYLKDNNINIVDSNGILHEIFSMSNMNMKLKYGVSLEDLINMYKGKSK